MIFHEEVMGQKANGRCDNTINVAIQDMINILQDHGKGNPRERYVVSGIHLDRTSALLYLTRRRNKRLRGFNSVFYE